MKEKEAIKFVEELVKATNEKISSLQAEVERLKPLSTEGVRELLKKQRGLCLQSYAHIFPETSGKDAADRIFNAPEPELSTPPPPVVEEEKGEDGIKTTELNHKGELVTIEWEKGYLVDESESRKCKIYETTGFDNNGSLWFGSWVEENDKFHSIGEVSQE